MQDTILRKQKYGECYHLGQEKEKDSKVTSPAPSLLIGNNRKKTLSLRKNMLLPPIPVSVSTQKGDFFTYGVFFLKHEKTIASIALAEGKKKHFLRFKRKSGSHRFELYYSSPYTGYASVENPGIIRSTKHQRLFGELQRATLCLCWVVPRCIQNLINIFMLLVLFGRRVDRSSEDSVCGR